jgi:PadR family transcriptional regulator, regulatory protein PadR
VTQRALGEFEHHVLLALVRLGGRVDVAAVVEELETVTGKAVSPAAVFIALRRLEQRGLARSQKREPRPGEGGRGRRAFQITAAGSQKLRASRRTLERLWGVLGPSAESR